MKDRTRLNGGDPGAEAAKKRTPQRPRGDTGKAERGQAVTGMVTGKSRGTQTKGAY